MSLPTPPDTPQEQDAAAFPAGKAHRARAARGSGERASTRIAGLDIARGLAVLGMFTAHLLTRRDLGWDPDSWRFIAFGRSAILFAVLAGISIALLSGRQTPLDGIPLVQARMRILVRAVLIFAIGGLVLMLDTGIAIILEYYGLFFALALPFLRWQPRRLFALAAVLTVAAPIAHLFLENLSENTERIRWSPTIVRLFAMGYYPAMIFIVYVLVGMGLGRLDLADRRVQLKMLGIGALLAVIGYTAGYATNAWWAPEPEAPVPAAQRDCVRSSDGVVRCTDPEPVVEPPPELWDFSGLWTFEQHTGSPFEITGSTGVAVAVLGVCLMLTRPMQRALYPLAAVGSMALSAYVGQLIAFHILRRAELRKYEVESLIWFTVATLVICALWKLVMGQGPLERLLNVVSSKAAGLPVRRSPLPVAAFLRKLAPGN
ncbi:MAG: heparan-alpha-glucosaminide N-acetyltransferase domain-containing protein [Thermomicrobiales bacterium]